MLLLFLSGCKDTDSQIYEQAVSQSASKASSTIANDDSLNEGKKTNSDKLELTGTITVSTYFDQNVGKRADAFMKLHPNVNIQLLVPDINSDAGFETLEDYSKRIAVELMSGNSADIIDMSHMSVYKYAKSGLLYNIYGLMDNDSDFNENDYYINVFKAKEYEGALYSLPFFFTYDMMYMSKPLLSAAGMEPPSELDYKKILQIYEDVLNKDIGESPHIMPGLLKESFFEYEFPAYYDTKSGKAQFDSEEFISYLITTQKMNTDYTPVNLDWDMNRIGGSDSIMKSEYLFCKLDMTAIDIFNFLIDYQNVFPPVPMLSSSGQAQFSTSMAEYGIAASCKNKELAWEFLKFCIEEKEPPANRDYESVKEYVGQFNSWVPINIKNFYHSFRVQCEYDIQNLNDIKAWKSGNQNEMIQQALDQVNEWNRKRNTTVSETEIWLLLEQELESYYYFDLSTAEECAANIQTKMTAFLNE